MTKFIKSCLRSWLPRRLWWDRTGASAVEFALLVPVLLLLLAGLADLGHGLAVRRKVNQMASTSGEMISMQTAWGSSDVSSILSGVSSILQPYDLDNLTILLCVVDIDKKGKATVAWSAAYGTTALSAGQDPPKDIPKDLQEEDVQMIVTRVQYRLNTILSGLFESFTGDGAYEYEQYFLTRPRNGDTITYG
jgi:Flp pilus assembly protein TadG